jgi:hypothetical protein
MGIDLVLLRMTMATDSMPMTTSGLRPINSSANAGMRLLSPRA